MKENKDYPIMSLKITSGETVITTITGETDNYLTISFPGVIDDDMIIVDWLPYSLDNHFKIHKGHVLLAHPVDSNISSIYLRFVLSTYISPDYLSLSSEDILKELQRFISVLDPSKETED